MGKTINDFGLNTFETHWETLSDFEKRIFIKKTADLDPRNAIIPVLAGITSDHPLVCDSAKKSLGIVQSKIGSLLANLSDKEQCLTGMNISTAVCSRMYTLIQAGMFGDELDYIFKVLLETNGKGPFFAFKVLYRGLISFDSMEKIILQVPERNRIAFVEQFLQTRPTERLKFGFAFKQILKSITRREAVIEFYASLFDRQQDADPFFYNISPELRDSDQIIAKEIQSQSSERKIMGLKALSILTTELPTELLTDMLPNEGQEVRITIYNVIENSPIGTYPELFSKILPFFYTRDRKEALPAFKALVVSGKFPLYTLLDKVRSNYPEFMQEIYREISALSKLSFFFLQEIALDKKKYEDKNFDVNLSCILGLTKKRPERVIKLVEQYRQSKGFDNNDVNQFIDKTKQLLVQEKKSIETEFNPVIQFVKKEAAKQTPISNNLICKKLKRLKNNKLPGVKSFQEEIIRNCDLSSLIYNFSALIFSKCIFNNCNFSRVSFHQSFFKRNIFYNTDMQKTKFDEVNFDNSIFINVNAKEASFINCSFQNVSVYNCNFNNTDLRDTSFVSSIISKASFDLADLSGSCFSFSKISAVSFETSNISQADFSNVGARFCKFPYHAKLDIRTESLDYNARKFQLSTGDMQVLEDNIVTEINIMLFCEFIQYGEKKFSRQNQLSLQVAFDIFKPRQADLFQLIPFLLHENYGNPDIIKFNNKAPCGIFNYIPSPESQDVIKKYIDPETISFRQSKDPVIEGLFTIGSIGSIAQTSNSDIDYWVCINEKKMTHKDIDLLKRKLETIERMAIEQFNIHVTFFLVDILMAKNNNFGDSTIESSGSAQARLLKEEFYRTMIHIAGKIPFWAVLPSSISINYYNSILNNIEYAPNFSRYIDLGDIHAIPRGEYFGASIWQMFKWLKSPFKSVIKMALLEKYIHEYGKEALLCNKYKDEWMNSGTYLKPEQNDSYFILLENLVTYFETVKDGYSVMLLLTCFFLKLGIYKDSQIDNTVFGLRKILLEKYIERWGWNKHNVFEIGNFKSWKYNEIDNLSDTIKNFMIQKYKIVNKGFDQRSPDRSLISLEDQTILGRKVHTEFSKKPGKIEKVLLVTRIDQCYRSLYLKYHNKGNDNIKWELLNRGTKADGYQEDSLFKTKTIEEIGAWLINNKLYDEELIVRLVPNPIDVTYNDIQKLLKAMFDFFNPLLTKDIHFKQFLRSEKVAALFVSIDFYAPAHQKKILEYTIIHLNSWGEMFHKTIYLDKGISTMPALKKDIRNRMELARMPVWTKVYYFYKSKITR